jgi:hypothetical protein
MSYQCEGRRTGGRESALVAPPSHQWARAHATMACRIMLTQLTTVMAYSGSASAEQTIPEGNYYGDRA